MQDGFFIKGKEDTEAEENPMVLRDERWGDPGGLWSL